jgi:hypothetical protein
MELNDIKKELYKQKPWAYFSYIREGIAYYYTNINQADVPTINFEIPVSDMGNADFEAVMSAQLLIRWIKL